MGRPLGGRHLHDRTTAPALPEPALLRAAGGDRRAGAGASARAVRVPALRERRSDISLLFHHFLHLAAIRFQVPEVPPTIDVVERLLAHGWPGNVRELKSAAERHALGMAALEGGEGDRDGAGSLAASLEAIERVLIEEGLRRHQGNVPRLGDELQLNQATLYRKLKAHRLDVDLYRPR